MKHYLIKSDLIYRKDTKAKPFYIYIILSILNKVPTKLLGFVRIFFRLFCLKSKFRVLNREMCFYIHSNIQSFKYHGGMAHELRISENLLRLTPKNSIFFDIGCAWGWYSILLSEKCKKVIGFDPYDKSSLINISLNKVNNFELYPHFLSDHQEKDREDITTIDNLVEWKFPKPNVIKIDVEGEEYKILLGSKNLFNKNPPEIVLVETHSEKLFYDCLEFLKSFGYQVYNLGCPKINTGGDIYPMSYNLEKDAFSTQSETRTLLGLKR